MTVDKPTGGIRWDGSINLGMMIQLISILLAMAAGWTAIDHRITIVETQHAAMLEEVKKIDSRTLRMELYMISKDPAYMKMISPDGGKE